VLFVIGTDLFVVAPALPLIAQAFAMPVNEAAWAVSLFSLCYMVGAPLTGALADRYGRARVAATGLALFAAANAATAAAPGFAALVATRAFAGLAASAVTPSIYAMLGRRAPPGRRATWLAVGVSGLLFGLTAGAPVGMLAGTAFGWRFIFVGVAGLAALAVPLICTWPDERSGAPAAAAAHRTGAILRQVSATVVWSTALYAVYTYLGLAQAGVGTHEIARVLSFYGAGALAGTFMGGRLADRIGSRAVMMASLLGLATILTVLRLAMAGDAGTIGVACGFAAASVLAQWFFPAQQAALAAAFAERPAAALAWNNSALFLGISLGAVVGGALFAGGGFAVVLGIAAALASVGAAALMLFF
jgi:predicted MFS family arabinose efflux permease